MKIRLLKKLIPFAKKRKKMLLAMLAAAAALVLIYSFLFLRNRNVVAVVDGYRITAQDIMVELELSPEIYRESVADNPESVINAYIDQVIVYRKAKRYAARHSRSVKARMKNFYMKTVSREFVEKELSKKIKIDDAYISEYYNTNIEDFILPERVKLYEIVLRERAQAEEILKRLSYGESFEAIALKESISDSRASGGDLGWIDIRKLDEEISSMVSGINPGDILANIIRTDLGYHIIKLGGKTERRILTISEATPSIVNILMSTEKKKEVDKLVSRQREKSRIKIYKERIPLIKEGQK